MSVFSNLYRYLIYLCRMRIIYLTLVALLTAVHPMQAQKISRSDRRSLQRLESHLSILAHDSMEGRRAGTPGESRASRYLMGSFSSYGLEPRGNDGTFLQSFPIPDGKKIMPATRIQLQGTRLDIPFDGYPLSISGNGTVEAKKAIVGVMELGQPWFIDLHPILEESAQNPHFDLNAAILEKSETAKKKGASAIIWYDLSNDLNPSLRFDPKYNGATLDIPVVFIGNAGLRKTGFSNEGTYDVSIQVQIEKSFRTAHNVIAYLDRQAAYTIIVGAHYDHLGYGEDGNSMIRNGPLAIHNGADDNASGTSALLDLAYQYAENHNFRKFNLLFIAFSGEELGLLGSRYFTEHPTFVLDKVSFMINMDMVGRLNESAKTITIGGYGTSPSWSNIIANSHANGLTLRYDSSGTGPSDHTSFYRKDIPVLFFFTGLHSDYHKPSDDADKINASGMVRVIHVIKEIIAQADHTNRLPFSKTREQQTTTTARFTVSMGIMPDYSYTGNGVRIDGVSDGKPAKKVGILAGDILISMGTSKVTSVESYMQTLSKFKKGDGTQVVVIRNGQEYTFNIVF